MSLNKRKSIIFGIKGKELSGDESQFLSANRPVGFILFSRNIEDKAQLKKLIQSLKDIVRNEDILILVDQEGGRVCRLKEPHWYHPRAAKVFGAIAKKNIQDAKRAAYLHGRIIAHDLTEVGFNVDCAPVLDVPIAGAHDVIGDRAFSFDKNIITELAEQVAKGLTDGGILPIIKHIPGHGRAFADSHLNLPVVDASYEDLSSQDFYPFEKLSNMPMAMTAHVLYTAIDPELCATHSSKVIDVIRGQIKFGGILVSDCITMKALSGSVAERASKAFEAGCDIVIHSSGNLAEMKEVVSVSPVITIEQQSKLCLINAISDNFTLASGIEELESIFTKYSVEISSKNGIDPTEPCIL